MSDNETVIEHLILEVWIMDSGKICWGLATCENEAVNPLTAEPALLEAIENFISVHSENPVLINLLCQQNGHTVTRWLTQHDFTTFESFITVRSNMYRAHWHILGHEALPKLLLVCWSLEWLYHKLRGHFKQSESTRDRVATPVPATPTNKASDLSEGPLGRSQVGGGTVVPFRRPE